MGKDVFSTVGADGSMRMFDLRSLEHSTILYETPDLSPLLKVCTHIYIYTILVVLLYSYMAYILFVIIIFIIIIIIIIIIIFYLYSAFYFISPRFL